MKHSNHTRAWSALCILLSVACNSGRHANHPVVTSVPPKKDSVAVVQLSVPLPLTLPHRTKAGTGRYAYPLSLDEVRSDWRSEVCGIDISHWNGNINWKAVSLDNISFVYMKATEGVSYVDPSFNTNWPAIKNTRLVRGAYLYFLPALNNEKQVLQAQNFISTVKRLEKGDLPPMLDVEDDPEISVALFQYRLQIVERELETYFRVSPLIYTSKALYKKYLNPNNTFQRNEIWIADYSYQRPTLCDNRNLRIWQFTDKACIQGISGEVDMDIFYTTAKDLDAIAIRE